MEAAVHEFEMDRLAAMIREKIRLQKIREAGLTVSEREVDRALDKMFEAGKIDEKVASKLNKELTALADALEAWQKDPSKGDVIYEEMLSSTGTIKKTWEIDKINYGTLEKLAKFRAMIPHSVSDMKRMSRDSKKRDLMFEKLRMIVAPDVTVTDEEMKEEYEHRYARVSKKPDFRKIKKGLRQELISQKRDVALFAYLQEQIMKAKIEIKNEKFKDVLDILIVNKKKRSGINLLSDERSTA